MPDTLLSRPRSVVPPIPPPALPALQDPIADMRKCLTTARRLEQMAVEMDTLLADRAAKIAQTEKEHKTRIDENEKTYAGTKQQAAADEKAVEDVIERQFTRVGVSSPNIVPAYEGAGSGAAGTALTTGSGASASSALTRQASSSAGSIKNLTDNLSQAADSAAQNQQSSKAIKEGFSNIGTMGLWAIVPVIIAFAVWPVTLALLVLLGCFAAFNANKASQAIGKMREIAGLLMGEAEFTCKRVIASAQETYTEAKERFTQQHTTAMTSLRADYKDKQETLTQQSLFAYKTLSGEIALLNRGFVRGGWQDAAWAEWKPSDALPGCLRIGTAAPDMPRFQHHFPDLEPVHVPALVEYENNSGIVIHAGDALQSARQMAQSAILRLLATVPPAGVRFVFIDPVSLGGNVAGFMPLGEFETTLISGKAWSDPRHIDEALTEVTNHMETVIQKYLREEYKTIAAYNATARVKEAYRIIVVFDFPVNFSETAAKKLASIMRNGPRCGVFPIVVIDDGKPLPYGFNKQDLEQFAVVMQPSGGLVPAPAPRAVPEVELSRAVASYQTADEDDDSDDNDSDFDDMDGEDDE